MRQELGLEDRSGSSSCASWSMPATAISARASRLAAGLRPDRRAHAGDARTGGRGALLALAMGIPLGVLTALRPQQRRQHGRHDLLAGRVAMPTFVIASC